MVRSTGALHRIYRYHLLDYEYDLFVELNSKNIIIEVNYDFHRNEEYSVTTRIYIIKVNYTLHRNVEYI